YMIRCKMKTVEDSFKGSSLVRCHRKYIVNMDKVKVLRKEKEGTPASPFLSGGSKTKYKGYADLGVYAQYVIDNHFTAYINGGNLLNARRINYGMYVERGINVGVGVLVKF
ncbi:MAG: LytTR family transcriptional regulator DNA-binding domain-containing protein, partial [Bacteroidales bacterium]|nr:LytTR family transcriptional regulator DNA-binding domain-containing protein [Bacteroidales bacterium]